MTGTSEIFVVYVDVIRVEPSTCSLYNEEPTDHPIGNQIKTSVGVGRRSPGSPQFPAPPIGSSLAEQYLIGN